MSTCTRNAEFVGTCVELPLRHLDAYDDSSRSISHETFRRHLGAELVLELEQHMGYGKWLRLKDDHAVTYSRGKWRGRKAVCMMHSSIHHIWTTD